MYKPINLVVLMLMCILKGNSAFATAQVRQKAPIEQITKQKPKPSMKKKGKRGKRSKKKWNKQHIVLATLVGLGGILLSVRYKEEIKNLLYKKKKEITPITIYTELNKHIIGQDTAKKAISTIAFRHQQYIEDIASHKEDDPVFLPKVPTILVGPTGTGKTLLAQTLAQIMDASLCTVQINRCVSEGIKGCSLSEAIYDGFKRVGATKKQAERGIVFIDEIDKIAISNPTNLSSTFDARCSSLQKELLTIIEKGVVYNHRTYTRVNPEFLRTDHMLFIIAGAFTDVREQLKNSKIAFNEDNLRNHLLHSKQFSTEFLARLPKWVILDDLSKQEMKNVLFQPVNAPTKRYEKFFQKNNCTLIFDDSSLDAIQEKTSKLQLGARGATTVLEKVLDHSMYNITTFKNRELRITAKDVNEAFSQANDQPNNSLLG